jgi:hypothetical protein
MSYKLRVRRQDDITWKFITNPITIAKDQGVVVTQGTTPDDHAFGTLTSAISIGNTEINVTTDKNQVFDSNTSLIVGGSTITATDLVSVSDKRVTRYPGMESLDSPFNNVSQTCYVAFNPSNVYDVFKAPLFDDGIVRFGWESKVGSSAGRIQFCMIEGAGPKDRNPKTGVPWGNIESPGNGEPSGRLVSTTWNVSDAAATTVNMDLPHFIYYLYTPELSPDEMARGTISPVYIKAEPGQAPNYINEELSTAKNFYTGISPPFPIYNFTYHNLNKDPDVAATLQITKIQRT